jgi:hypothetical protein
MPWPSSIERGAGELGVGPDFRAAVAGKGGALVERAVKRFEATEASFSPAAARANASRFSLAAFEAGIGLVRKHNERLNAAETRVEVLTRDAEGRLKLEPLEPDSGIKE